MYVPFFSLLLIFFFFVARSHSVNVRLGCSGILVPPPSARRIILAAYYFHTRITLSQLSHLGKLVLTWREEFLVENLSQHDVALTSPDLFSVFFFFYIISGTSNSTTTVFISACVRGEEAARGRRAREIM